LDFTAIDKLRYKLSNMVRQSVGVNVNERNVSSDVVSSAGLLISGEVKVPNSGTEEHSTLLPDDEMDPLNETLSPKKDFGSNKTQQLAKRGSFGVDSQLLSKLNKQSQYQLQQRMSNMSSSTEENQQKMNESISKGDDMSSLEEIDYMQKNAEYSESAQTPTKYNFF